uniref:Uncharacterized protein n=1 Tax=Glossina palpalis gambiensis TaxID=67801 RepID=A0A1B0BZM3_9MUSC
MEDEMKVMNNARKVTITVVSRNAIYETSIKTVIKGRYNVMEKAHKAVLVSVANLTPTDRGPITMESINRKSSKRKFTQKKKRTLMVLLLLSAIVMMTIT